MCTRTRSRHGRPSSCGGRVRYLPAPRISASKGRTSSCYMPRAANWPWKMIFWPARSVAATMRAQGDDRSDPQAAHCSANAVAGGVALLGLLHASADAGSGSGADAKHRSAALGTSVCRRPDGARFAQVARLQDRPQARRDAHAQARYRGAVPQGQHQSPLSRAPDLSVSAARPVHRATQSGVGHGFDLQPDGARLCLPDGGAGLGEPQGSGLALSLTTWARMPAWTPWKPRSTTTAPLNSE